MKRILPILLALIAVSSLIANVLLYMRYSTTRPLMTMNDTVITKKDYQDMMDALYGRQTLTKMAYAKIIHNATVKNNVTVSDSDVDARIAEVHRRSPAVVEAAQRDPLRAQLLKDEVRTTLELENIRIKDIKVTDDEALAFFQQNKQAWVLPLQTKTTMAVAENEADAGAAKEMMANKVDLNVISQSARIRVVGINGFAPNWNVMPPADRGRLTAEVNQTPVGQSKIITVQLPKKRDDGSVIMAKYFFVVRVDTRSDAGVPPYETIKNSVLRLAKLDRANKENKKAEDILAQLYREANVVFEVPKYAAYFEDVNQYMKNIDATKGTEVK